MANFVTEYLLNFLLSTENIIMLCDGTISQMVDANEQHKHNWLDKRRIFNLHKSLPVNMKKTGERVYYI